MLDGELAVLEAIARNDDEASISDIEALLKDSRLNHSERQIRAQLRKLSQKGNVVWQKHLGLYALTHQGKERLLVELAYHDPHSALLKRERQKQQFVVPVTVEALEEGGYLAICPSIQGCHAEGNTVAEALENLEDAARVLLRLRKREGLPQPQELERFTPERVLEAQLVVPGPE